MATCRDCIHKKPCNRLRNREFYDEQGAEIFCKDFKDESLFLKLPCKVGNKAYFVLQLDDEWCLSEETVVDFSTRGFYYSEFLDDTGANILVPYDEIGENVFFNKAQAEEKLKEREGK